MNLNESFVALLWMIGYGLLITLCWDSLRYAFRRQKGLNGLVFFWDIAAWIGGAGLLFQRVYLINGGEFRLVFLIAAGVGAWLYQRVFCRPARQMNFYIVRLLCFVIQCCKRFLFVVVIKPIVWILLKILKLLRLVLFWIASCFFPIFWLKIWENRIRILVQRMTNFDKRRPL